MTQQILTAAEYHRATSYRRHRLTPHTLDWAHQPVLVKRYPELPRVALDRSEKLPEIDYFDLVHRCRTIDSSRSEPLDIQKLSTAFRLTHDVTARREYMGQPFYYRSVASAGALYPFELYLAVHHIDGLDPGVYHYHLLDFSLTALRRGPVPEIPPVDCGVVATVYVTGIFFRSAWKYRSRAYRYVLLDAGHLLENLRLALGALDLSFSIHLDFEDERAATLLGLDPQREACLVCVHLHGDHTGKKKTGAANGPKPLSGEILQASTVSDKEVAYADILTVHRAGNVANNRSVDALPTFHVLGNQPAAWIDLNPPDHPGSADYARVLWQRRSRRNFVPASVPRDGFMTFVDLMTRSMGKASVMPSACRSVLTTGFLTGMGMPISPGFYLLDPDAKRLGRVFDGRLTEPVAAACLDQMWLKHAALHLLFMTDLAALDQTWGPRGYRYAMIEAGSLGQQAYLAATVLGWGVCGIGAIYDREAAVLLDLAVDGALLYLVGAGPVKTR
ncbi:MAG: SagB family peptide dehydrogenase [Desulfosarcina sp.]|nr:SagB family peptide dehydrogenase [Desulfosarcina sp.]MBC2743736.1 SagB family peptide dehydrogenase [Desulfosarcina sp.]MBC2766645.1 SagB/ThcOx family dehydrogenase [Desulfosarcina sp.]